MTLLSINILLYFGASRTYQFCIFSFMQSVTQEVLALTISSGLIGILQNLVNIEQNQKKKKSVK